MGVALIVRFAAADAYDPPTNYYEDASGFGETLQGLLRTIISEMEVVSYGDARYSAPFTDADPDTPGNILLIYNRASVGGGWSTNPLIWNREHIWPDSRLSSASDSDQFNLRPANPTINGNRGNKAFGLDTNSGDHGPVGADYYYPGDVDAGDVARSQFYMATRYSVLSLTDAVLPETGGSKMGDLSSLINYHFNDVPDTFERRRNHAIYGLPGAEGIEIDNPYPQENRNPYVDHPEWVWSVYQNQTNDSQITIDSASTNGTGGSTMNVDLGRVFVGGAVPAAQQFMLNKAGLNGTYYEVTMDGLAISSLSGRFNAFRNNQSDGRQITVGLSTEINSANTTDTSGIKSGTVTVNNLDITSGYDIANTTTGHAANDENDTFNVGLTVLNHATPSFAGDSILESWTHNFGTLVEGDAAPIFNFDVFNFGTLPAFTADLDFDGFAGNGDLGAFTTTLADSVGSLSLVVGEFASFTASLDTSVSGAFETTFTLNFSDEDLVGAQNDKLLTLTLIAEVIDDRLDGDYNGDGAVDAADYTVWRDTLGTGVEPYGGADGDGSSFIDEGDYAVWKDNIGMTTQMGGGIALSPISAPSMVPEPSAMMLTVLLTAMELCHRRRRSRRYS